jgi:hypothetical protein
MRCAATESQWGESKVSDSHQGLTSAAVIMPVYFDSQSALALTRDVRMAIASALPNIDRVKVVWVDDSGRVDREFIAAAAAAGVSTIRPSRNYGHQKAIVTGLRTTLERCGPFDLYVTLDSDGEDRAIDVPVLINAMASNGVEIALAERGRRSEGARFRVGYLLFRVMYRTLTGHSLKTGNFAVMTRTAALAVSSDPIAPITYSGMLAASRIPATRVTLPRGRRYHGRSRMAGIPLTAHGLTMILPRADAVAVRSLYLFFAMASLALMAISAAIAMRAFTSAAFPGWTTNVVVGGVSLTLAVLVVFLISLTIATIVRITRSTTTEPPLDLDD